MSDWSVMEGDCLELMRGLAANSVDAVVCDPPAGIAFMAKEWDRDKGGRDAWIAWLADVMRECLRVMKPGAHALVWALPRTSHWTGMALEEAGFEVRDRISHLFGSGFPKSLDVSKAIDKHGGQSIAWFGPWLRTERERRGIPQKELARHFPSKTGNLTGCVANWELGLNMPTPDQFNTLCEVMGLPFARIEEAEREVVGHNDRPAGWFTAKDGHDVTAPATDLAKQWAGWGTALKPAAEDWWLCRKPLSGTVAQCVSQWGTGALNIDATRIGTGEDRSGGGMHSRLGGVYGARAGDRGERPTGGRWPPNVCLSCDCPEPDSHDPHCAVRLLDEQSGERGGGFGISGGSPDGHGIYNRKFPRGDRSVVGYGDSGGASRFYYCAKSSRAERSAGLGDLPATHPTVKPLALMRWLVRLVTPPGGLILDPFAGSGTTGAAAVLEGFRFLGMEQGAEYVEIAERRIAYWARESARNRAIPDPNLFEPAA